MKKRHIKINYGLTEGMFLLLVETGIIKQESEVSFTFNEEQLLAIDKNNLKQILKQRKNETIKNKAKQRWANYSKEEHQSICSSISSGTKEAMHRPDVYKKSCEANKANADAIGKTIKEQWASYTEEEYLTRCKAISNGLAAMSNEAKQCMVECMTDSLKLLYKDEHYKELHRLRVKSSMTPEVCLHISKATKEAMHRPDVYKKSCEANKANADAIGKILKSIWSNSEKRYKQSLKCQEGSIKGHEIKKKNNSYSRSKQEDNFYALLCSMFKEVRRQEPYKSRTSYHADFYIVDIDLFIELNYYWQHGGRLYDKNDESCQEQLNYWSYKAQTNKNYINAIERWTQHDPYRLQLAKDSNMNMMFIYPDTAKQCIKQLQKMKKETNNENN